MKIRNLPSLIFLTGLAIMLTGLMLELPFAQVPMRAGQAILAEAPDTTGAANMVTSVVLAYRGLDTLGELTILFVAATAAGMVLGNQRGKDSMPEAGFILKTAVDLLHPFLMVLGAYIILHGHLTPGGGFQGGVILAVAFFLPLLAMSKGAVNDKVIMILESLAGATFIVIGLAALANKGAFLAPLLGTGTLGNLFSAGSLPLLYLAVGLKVGAELAGLMSRLFTTEVVRP
jgi:multicomponent Na+:H+ antiporter subunit B